MYAAVRSNGGLCLRAVARERHESSYMMLILFSGMLIRDIEMIPLRALTGCETRVPQLNPIWRQQEYTRYIFFGHMRHIRQCILFCCVAWLWAESKNIFMASYQSWSTDGKYQGNLPITMLIFSGSIIFCGKQKQILSSRRIKLFIICIGFILQSSFLVDFEHLIYR